MIPWLGQVKAEGTWQPLNEPFEAEVPEAVPGEGMKNMTMKFPANSFSVGTIMINDVDAKDLGISTGDLVELTNPLGKSTKGKIFATGGIRPGVIKLGFGAGGRWAPGMGPAYKSRKYTPYHNMLIDPDALSPIMGFPAFADMIVNIKKV